MKKVCIYSNGITAGGTDTFVINLCKGLNKRAFEPIVVLSVDGKENSSREQELIDAGARTVRTCALRGIFGKLRHLHRLRRILKAEECDIFQTNTDLFNGPNLFIAWLAGVPVRICHSHNSQQSLELKEGRTLRVRAYQSAMRFLCWVFSNRRCGCSELAMDFLYGGKWRSDSSSFVIHNGIDLALYRDGAYAAAKKGELDLGKRYNILTVGRIDFQKNPLFIVDVFNELCKLRDDCDLVWVGKGDMEQKVNLKVAEYGISDRVHMLGTRSDVASIMHACNLFLLPSLFEGLAIALIEAQAAGLPCVVSDSMSPESNCGMCLYTKLDKGASYWAKTISCALDGEIRYSLDSGLLRRFSIEYMTAEMERVFSE